MRRRHAGALLVLIILACQSVPAGGEHDAIEVAWWTRSPIASAPDGGIAVALAPDGPLTVAAIRTPRPSNAERVLFEAVEVGGVATDSAVVLACAVSAAWEPSAGGPLADAPATMCSPEVALARDAASASWTADLTAIATAGEPYISIALTPGSGTTPAGFEVRLAHPRLVFHVNGQEPERASADLADRDVIAAPSPSAASSGGLPAQAPAPVRVPMPQIAPPDLALVYPTAREAVRTSPVEPIEPGSSGPTAGWLVAISLAVGSATVGLRKAQHLRAGQALARRWHARG